MTIQSDAKFGKKIELNNIFEKEYKLKYCTCSFLPSMKGAWKSSLFTIVHVKYWTNWKLKIIRELRPEITRHTSALQIWEIIGHMKLIAYLA